MFNLEHINLAMSDNPSYKCLKHDILEETGGSSTEETLYTRNLKEAKKYFKENLNDISLKGDFEGLREIYKNLTEKFLFNEYVIKDDLDVFVMFETMNNRGKSLSNLELLKNRLLYCFSKTEKKKPLGTIWKTIKFQLNTYCLKTLRTNGNPNFLM